MRAGEAGAVFFAAQAEGDTKPTCSRAEVAECLEETPFLPLDGLSHLDDCFYPVAEMHIF